MRVTAGPFLSLKRCIVQLQSFPLIEELTRRPLTRRSLPHCARGRGEQQHHLGGESCAENGLILYGARYNWKEPVRRAADMERAAKSEPVTLSDRLRAR